MLKDNAGTGTGYFKIPGSQISDHTKLHFVLNGKPICGAALGPKMKFLRYAFGFDFVYVECGTCKRIGSAYVKR